MGRTVDQEVHAAFVEFRAKEDDKCLSVQCIYCQQIRAKNTSRQKQHLLECPGLRGHPSAPQPQAQSAQAAANGINAANGYPPTPNGPTAAATGAGAGPGTALPTPNGPIMSNGVNPHATPMQAPLPNMSGRGTLSTPGAPPTAGAGSSTGGTSQQGSRTTPKPKQKAPAATSLPSPPLDDVHAAFVEFRAKEEDKPGGQDSQVVTKDSVTSLKATYMLQTADDPPAYIIVKTDGWLTGAKDVLDKVIDPNMTRAVNPNTYKYRVHLSMETGDDRYAFLNTLMWIGSGCRRGHEGCSTCKAKRLKCDESKPSCLQCERRKVPCGGYKKDFKWRPFEETNVANKTAVRGKNVVVPPSVSSRKAKADVPPPPASEQSALPAKTQSTSAGGKKSPSKPNERRLPQDTTPRAEEQVDQPNRDTLNEQTPESWLEDLELPGPSPWISGVSPSSADLESTPFGMMLSSSPSKSDSFSFSALLAGDGEEIEDIVRQSEPGAEPWLLIPDMGMGLSSSADDDNTGHMATGGSGGIPREPDLGLGSPEMLALRFNRVTCGILSIKDGMHENPWRRLVWPLAKDTPALYHALFSLAAFHSCKENPTLRVHGVDHMRQSITCMVQDIRNMRTDAALATSLALAFADTWDQHTRSCIQHLRGAKALVSQVLELASRGTLYGADLERVRFLYNTWLYMDVISRLTSREGCEVPKMDTSIFHLPGGGQDEVVHEIDPLMGCATTLFPLINQVAGLIQRVRKSDSNSISLVSQAIELKRLVEQWEPPRWFEPPEDPTSEVQHSIQVAHAYRWATLLYLHQAVPEMPSEPTSELAKRVLILLATVPPSSRTTIIQMFPLMAAGCEAEQEEDRNWVLNRWMAVQSRLMLGGIDRCIEIVREVWNRQDAFQVDQERGGHKRSRSSTVYDAPGSWRKTPRRNSAVTGLDNIEYERTVRGRLHWVNVMDKWGWEVFL